MQKNPGFAGFVTDDDYNVRFAMKFTPDGGNLVLRSPTARAAGTSSSRSAWRTR